MLKICILTGFFPRAYILIRHTSTMKQREDAQFSRSLHSCYFKSVLLCQNCRSLAAAHCHLYIGNCLRGMDRLGEAIAHYELCLGIHTEKQGVDSTHRAQALRALGYAYYQENRVDVAIATFADAVRVTRLSTKDDGRALAHCLNNLASIEMDAGLSQDSRKHFDEALSLYIRVHGEMHPEVARTMKRICDLLNQEGHYDEAIRIQTRATKIQRQIFGSDHEEYADSIQSIACFYSNKGHLSKAMDLFNQALCIHTKNGVENCRVALCHINMAKTQERRGDHKVGSHPCSRLASSHASFPGIPPSIADSRIAHQGSVGKRERGRQNQLQADDRQFRTRGVLREKVDQGASVHQEEAFRRL